MREDHRAQCVLFAVNQEVYGHSLRCVEGATAKRGAGEGNRTLVVSLGSFCSAIELHPRGGLIVPTAVGKARVPGVWRSDAGPGQTAANDHELVIRSNRALTMLEP